MDLLNFTNLMLDVNKPPRCMTVVENNTFSNLTEPDSISSRIQVLVSTGEGPIMVLQESKWREINLSAGKIGAVEKISASPDGKKLALFGDLGSVALVSSNFQECFSVSSMKIKIPPTDMVWCGNEAVLCYWQNTSPLTVLLIDQSGDYINYEFDETMLHFVLECDGVRIISPLACEFLQKVPESTRSVFEIGSVSPAAMLYDATEAFETRSAKADEIIRGINGSEDLESAVFACVSILRVVEPLND